MAAPEPAAANSGSTAFDDGYSYGAEGFRDGVQFILDKLCSDPALLTDNRRVELAIPRV